MGGHDALPSLTVLEAMFGAMRIIRFARLSGRYAAPLAMIVTELRSAFFVFGLLTN